MASGLLTGLTAAQFLALLTLLTVGLFTPGPNTTIAAVTGANFGLRATLPHCVGVPSALPASWRCARWAWAR